MALYLGSEMKDMFAGQPIQGTPRSSSDLTVSGATVTAPAGYYSQNASKSVNTETKTVDLSMASGNQTINPTSGKLLTSVVVKKPSTLIAGNIAKGVSIAGITGTFEGGITPSGTLNITANGNGIDVTTYKYVNVNVVDPKVTVTFNGPKNSTLTYSGPDSGTLSFNNVTTITALLTPGNYTFTSKLTIDGVENTIFVINKAINSTNNICNLYPAKTLYWYGIDKFENNTITFGEQALAYGGYNVVQGEKQTNCVYLQGGASTQSASQKPYYAGTNLVDITGYSTLHLVEKHQCSPYNSSYTLCYFGGTYNGSNPPDMTSNATRDKYVLDGTSDDIIAEHIHSLSTSHTNQYLCVSSFYNRYEASKYAKTYIYALWLE